MGEKCCLAREGNHCVKESSLPLLLSAVTVRKTDIALLKASTDGSDFLYTLQQQRKAEGRELAVVAIMQLVIQ